MLYIGRRRLSLSYFFRSNTANIKTGFQFVDGYFVLIYWSFFWFFLLLTYKLFWTRPDGEHNLWPCTHSALWRSCSATPRTAKCCTGRTRQARHPTTSTWLIRRQSSGKYLEHVSHTSLQQTPAFVCTLIVEIVWLIIHFWLSVLISLNIN